MSEILFNVDSTTNSVAALQSTMDAAVTITDNADNGYTYRIVIRIERSEGDIGDGLGQLARVSRGAASSGDT